jgi:hypothetical protein
LANAHFPARGQWDYDRPGIITRPHPPVHPRGQLRAQLGQQMRRHRRARRGWAAIAQAAAIFLGGFDHAHAHRGYAPVADTQQAARAA